MTTDHPAPRRPLRRSVLLRLFRGRPRLMAAMAVFVALAVALPMATEWRWPSVFLVAWNIAVVLVLVLDFTMMATADEKTLAVQAARLDEGQDTILALSVIAGVASLVAIVAELVVVKDLTGLSRLTHIGLATATVVTSWAFIHVMFAIHYAHEYARSRHAAGGPGLRIPGEEHPDYLDFLYVAVVIGTSGQTADVEFTSKRMRRIGLAHCALAFFFNTTVLALTVNIAAGLM